MLSGEKQFNFFDLKSANFIGTFFMLMYRRIVIVSFLFFSFSTFCQSKVEFRNFKNKFRKSFSGERLDSARFYLNKMAEVAESSQNDSLLMVSKDQYAFFNFFQGNYEKSTAYLIEASEIAFSKGYKNIHLDMLNNLGAIFAKLNEYEKSKEIYIRVLQLSDSVIVSKDYVATLSNLGSAYQNLGKIDSANVIIEKALKLSKENNYKKNTASLLKFAAKNKYLSKDYEKVIDLVDDITQDYDTIISPSLLDDAYFYRAQAYFELNNFNAAEKDIKTSLDLMKVQKKDPALVERLMFYSKIKEKQKDFKTALEIQNQVIKVKDSFDEITMRQNVLDIEEKYQAEKKEKENLQLKEEGYKKDILLSKSRNETLLIIVFFVILLFVIITYYLTLYKKKNKQLNKSIERRTKLEKKLNSVRENIAQDFHDDLGNKLASITVLTDVLSKKMEESENKKIVKKIQENSDGLYKGTKDFIWALTTKSDYLEELITYLSDFGEDFFHKLNISFTIKKNIQSNVLLPPYWSRHLILIFKEAMTNVAKHSQAKECEIHFFCDDSILKIILIDYGKGFSNVGKAFQNGLENMKKRASKINGEIDIITNTNGTQVLFQSKLPKKGS